MQSNLFGNSMTLAPPVIGENLPALPSLYNVDSLAIDTETTTEPWLFDRTLCGISYYLPDGRKNYIPLRHPGGGNYPEENVRRWFKGEVQNKTLVCANAKHEHHTLKKWGADVEELGCSFRDVFHAAALINEKRYKINMDILVETDLHYQKAAVKHQLLHQMPAHEAAAVAIEDAWLAWRLDEVYEPKIQEEGLGEVLDLENAIVFSTCEMERNGSYLDIELLLRWSAEVKQEYEQRLMDIFRLTGLAINPNSGKDLSRLFKHIGIKNDFKTETGEESFGEDQLLEFIGRHDVIKPVIEARQLHSLDSKYLKKYLASVRPDGRIYYSLHQMRSDEGGTITGRYSSSMMYRAAEGGINIQQVSKTKKMPKFLQRWPIRKLFIPPPGRRYFSSDASQIEYRLFAHYASRLGRDRLAKQYRDDPKTDFHNVVMAWTGLNRDHTKNVNFCKLYGGRARKVCLMINMVNKQNGKPLISLKEAEQLVRKYDHEFPEANDLLDMAQKQAGRMGFVRTLLGRRCRFELRSETERYYRALNCVLQGGATGDLVKLKILHMYNERRRLDITMRDQVHDEINGDLPGDHRLPEMAGFMNEQEYQLEVPILWESGTGPNWEEVEKYDPAKNYAQA